MGGAVNPYWPDGTTLPFIFNGTVAPAGHADNRVQAYNFRLCVTQNTSNRSVRSIKRPHLLFVNSKSVASYLIHAEVRNPDDVTVFRSQSLITTTLTTGSCSDECTTKACSKALEASLARQAATAVAYRTASTT